MCVVPECQFNAFSLKSLLSHHRHVHREDLTFAVSCLIVNCSHVNLFNTESALNKHIQFHHSSIENPTSNNGLQIEAVIEENPVDVGEDLQQQIVNEVIIPGHW